MIWSARIFQVFDGANLTFTSITTIAPTLLYQCLRKRGPPSLSFWKWHLLILSEDTVNFSYQDSNCIDNTLIIQRTCPTPHNVIQTVNSTTVEDLPAGIPSVGNYQQRSEVFTNIDWVRWAIRRHDCSACLLTSNLCQLVSVSHSSTRPNSK
jgi:hypothetical protein